MTHPTQIIPAPGPALLAPPLAEAEAALVVRIREAAITLPDQTTRANILAEARSLSARADALGAIRGRADYETAAALLRDVKRVQREAKDAFGQVPEIVRAVQGWRDTYTLALDGAETGTKSAMLAYDQREEESRRKREAKAREEAEAEARAERDRLAEEARAASAKAKADGDTAGARALAAEAKQIAAAPVVAAPVEVETRRPDVEGISYRETWSAEVTDLGALVRHVAAHPELIGLVRPDPAALNRMARGLRGTLHVPGVAVRCERGVAAGAK